MLSIRTATATDCPLLAAMNQQLIRDEGHRNPMTVEQLEERMRGWLACEYRAVIFEEAGVVVAYALYREEPQEIYLRHLFVVRERRSQGIGSQAVEMLRNKVWPATKRLTVEVLTGNERGVAFWRKVGYRDYCMTLEILPQEQTTMTDEIKNQAPDNLQSGLTVAERQEYEELDRLTERTPEQNERWLFLLSKSKTLFG